MPNVIGNKVNIRFSDFNKEAEGKVDTGATVSSLHAEDIDVDQDRGTVSFVSPVFSENRVKMSLHGVQDVASADGGNNARPTVKLNVVIDGKPLSDQLFNLNDRSNMDCPILIGQNILQAGDFHIDVNKDGQDKEEIPESAVDEILNAFEILSIGDITVADISSNKLSEDEASEAILNAIKVVSESQLTIKEMVQYLKRLADLSKSEQNETV